MALIKVMRLQQRTTFNPEIFMPDDYSPHAVAERLKEKAQNYRDIGDKASAAQAELAAERAENSGSPEAAHREELSFMGGDAPDYTPPDHPQEQPGGSRDPDKPDNPDDADNSPDKSGVGEGGAGEGGAGEGGGGEGGGGGDI